MNTIFHNKLYKLDHDIVLGIRGECVRTTFEDDESKTTISIYKNTGRDRNYLTEVASYVDPELLHFLEGEDKQYWSQVGLN